MACADPTAVSGGTLVTSSPYADGSVAVFQCTSGYVMSGTPYITCNTGVWIGTYPTCSKQDTNTLTVNNTDNESFSFDTFPTWLGYVIAAVCGVLILLVMTCVLVWCLQLLGCYEPGRLFGAYKRCGCCARKTRYDVHQEDQHQRQCTTYPRRYQYDENGRRFHFDDQGRPCFYEHRNRNTHKVATISSAASEYPASENESKITFASAVNEVIVEKRQQPAKEINAWKPHIHNVRSINTSTK